MITSSHTRTLCFNYVSVCTPRLICRARPSLAHYSLSHAHSRPNIHPHTDLLINSNTAPLLTFRGRPLTYSLLTVPVSPTQSPTRSRTRPLNHNAMADRSRSATRSLTIHGLSITPSNTRPQISLTHSHTTYRLTVCGRRLARLLLTDTHAPNTLPPPPPSPIL